MTINIRSGSVNEIRELERLIPEFAALTPIDKLRARLESGLSLILVATLQSELVGYKAGYALSTNEFYSWLGAVHPLHRGKGIAQSLLLRQEEWAVEQGFNSISVKSSNRFPAMMHLLIANQYQIVDTERGLDLAAPKIVFRKTLIASR